LLDKTLHLFEPVTLETLSSRAALQNRIDKKFVFPVSMLRDVLLQCINDYQVLSIGNRMNFGYTTGYYDTEGLAFYHMHHNGNGNRCKVRTRLYENTGLQFVEVKQKNNKGKTIKYRIPGNDIYAADDFVQQYAGCSSAALKNCLTINYSRITLLHKLKTEKVTFDLQFKCTQNSDNCSYKNVVFTEVKTNKNIGIDFCDIMKARGIKSGSLSKYCLGLISMNEQLRHNNFKQLYSRLIKVNNDGKI
jgi:VTC domain